MGLQISLSYVVTKWSSFNRLIEISHRADFGLTLQRPKNHRWHLCQLHKLWIYINYDYYFIINILLNVISIYSIIFQQYIQNQSQQVRLRLSADRKLFLCNRKFDFCTSDWSRCRWYRYYSQYDLNNEIR